MTMRVSTWLRRLFGRSITPDRTPSGGRPGALTPERRAELEGMLKAFEDGRLCPPKDPRSAPAWDEYWRNQLQFGAMEIAFGDMMASDPALPSLFQERGIRTVLCAGNGFSTEPLSLALFGFDVTALDISSMPSAGFANMVADPDQKLRQQPGFTTRDDGAIVFGVSDIAPPAAPKIHRGPTLAHSGGGSLRFVTGDLFDASVCPGPFDAVIERRTLQLFTPTDQSAALHALEARLAPRAVFVSQQHNGGWRPGQDRHHYAQQRLAERGFALNAAGADRMAERLALLRYTSG